VNLTLNDGNSGGHFISRNTGAAAALTYRPGVTIRTVTCDEILAGQFAELASRVGLVWMDIEGHEGYFFEGARNTIARDIPVVSEFYPVAIERSGMGGKEYARIVRSLFTHVCTLENGRFVEQPIDIVERLLDEYYEQGATNVIFLRRSSVT
jgi:hypothetical protein